MRASSHSSLSLSFPFYVVFVCTNLMCIIVLPESTMHHLTCLCGCGVFVVCNALRYASVHMKQTINRRGKNE